MIRSTIVNVIRWIDLYLVPHSLRFLPEKDALVVLRFHCLYRDSGELLAGHSDPAMAVTVNEFRLAVMHFLKAEYKFIIESDILRGLAAPGKYLWITFDDGYRNCLNALPVLQDLRIPATFFVSPYYIRSGKSFWWDVLYRKGQGSGVNAEDFYRQVEGLKKSSIWEIERFLAGAFGQEALLPRRDLDRPLNPSELRALSDHPLVSIGNHTVHHAALANFPIDTIRTEIREAQLDIEELTGTRPTAISYPHGSYTSRVMSAADQEGLSVGVTVDQRKNYFPLDAEHSLMGLGRFGISRDNIKRQCRSLRSDFSLLECIRVLRK